MNKSAVGGKGTDLSLQVSFCCFLGRVLFLVLVVLGRFAVQLLLLLLLVAASGFCWLLLLLLLLLLLVAASSDLWMML